ncbi:MAG: sigma-70 family RNA polymerase sigma factor [Bacteroidetes bacterium]|nr:sigma-70 family RNA polymerase sigma factor [Bacteroidota bacterium]MCH8231913.1 sigma-70 family RNA polymerase sigma factor [Bacteroidota bacterium]
MRRNNLSDSELVALYQNGNEEAFEELVNRYKARIFTSIYLIVKDNYLAEDILQETFIKAINTIKRGKYNEEGKFLPWIMRIAHNLAVDHFRKSKRFPVVVMEDGSPVFNTVNFSEAPFETVQIQKEIQDKVRYLIQDLPDTQKQVLIMRHYMDLSFQEIADTTGVSINTALGRMRYALINLRKRMKKYKIAYDQNFYP